MGLGCSRSSEDLGVAVIDGRWDLWGPWRRVGIVFLFSKF